MIQLRRNFLSRKFPHPYIKRKISHPTSGKFSPALNECVPHAVKWDALFPCGKFLIIEIVTGDATFDFIARTLIK
jgi:hypothetical protein